MKLTRLIFEYLPDILIVIISLLFLFTMGFLFDRYYDHIFPEPSAAEIQHRGEIIKSWEGK